MQHKPGRTSDEMDTNGRQHLLAAAMAVVAIVAIVAVVVGPWREGDAMSGNVPGNDEAGERERIVPKPPAVATSTAHLVVSPDAVPAQGGEIALIMVNPGSDPLDYGPSGRLQRWDGATWTDHRQLTTSLGPDQPAGGLHDLDVELMMPAIALSAPGHGFGAPVWSRIQGVTPGWYRVQLGIATGLFEVGGTPTDDVTRPGTSIAFTGTTVVPAGRASSLILEARPRDPRAGSFDRDEQIGRFTAPARVERRDGVRWVLVPSDTLKTRDGEETGGPFTVRLPDLEPGVYRVSREASTAGRVESLFWVVRL